jgi:hypothetical protein
MRLKVITTILFILGILGVAALPFLLQGVPGPGAGQQTRVNYSIGVFVFFGVLSIIWVAVAALALLIIRRERMAFAAEKKDNLNQLIEGTLKDHGRQQSSSMDEPRD